MKLFSKSLKPEEVINFLKENPDFFIDHPEAIEHLEIKHESGEAVSFIEKQVEFIKSKNLATSTQLKDFILNANANELLFTKVRKLISIILSAEDLEKSIKRMQIFLKIEMPMNQQDLTKIDSHTEKLAWPKFCSDLDTTIKKMLSNDNYLEFDLSTLLFDP